MNSRNAFIKNLIILVSGTAGAQAVGLLASPVITRIYSPEMLGLLGTFLALQTILNPIATMSYPLAIVIPRYDFDAKRIALLSTLIVFLVFIIQLIILVLFGQRLLSYVNLDNVHLYIILIPLAVLLSGFIAILSQWINRKKDFKIKAKAVFVQSLGVNSLKLAIGLLYPSALGLIVITILGSALHLSLLYCGTKQYLILGVLKHKTNYEKEKIKRIAVKYKDFAVFRTPQIVLNAISISMPVLVLAAYFGPSIAGFYSLARSILGLPISLIGEAVTSVFYPRVNDAVQNNEDSRSLIIKSTLYMALIGIIPFGIVILWGPWLFATIFGENWHTAGIYAQWLSVWLYSGLVNRPCIASIPVLNMQKKLLIIEVISIVGKAISLAIGAIVFSNEIISLALFSIFSFIVNAVIILATIRECSKIGLVRF